MTTRQGSLIIGAPGKEALDGDGCGRGPLALSLSGAERRTH